jgi:hypothetical protein
MTQRFISDPLRGCDINVAHVRSIRVSGDKSLVTLADGGSISIDHAIDTEWLNGTVVPAQPGFFVLYPLVDESGPPSSYRYPVIAWFVDVTSAHYTALPITTDGRPHGDDWAILQPDGQVVVPGDLSYDSLDTWIADKASERPNGQSRTLGETSPGSEHEHSEHS